MLKLVVIADDFTGAMDTGVQFHAKNTLVRIDGQVERDPFSTVDDTVQVLIIDAESRHMRPDDAYKTVSHIVTRAVEENIPCIYKKTDSGLRGNIGAELTAMLLASGEKRLHFIPAFPKMGRITKNGIHYVDGVPVAVSIFGRDPFEPVRQSAVAGIIREQSDAECFLVGTHIPEQFPEGLIIYDADSDEALSEIADTLKRRGEFRLLAGCAGFAAALPKALELEQASGGLPEFVPRLLTVCGSINPITVGQLDAAEQSGALRVRLTPEQKLDGRWPDSPEGQRSIAQWMAQIRDVPNAILECSGADDRGETRACAARLGLSLDEMRQRIAETMGGLLKRMLDLGLESTLLVTGGDTLFAFLRQIGVESLAPICELRPGVVLSQVVYRGRIYNLISKSGGFGGETLLAELEQIITQSGKRSPDTG